MRYYSPRGFWLADTSCTQALWQAVLGENPSGFRGAERPVENVSWEHVTERFLPALDRLVPGLASALPTEAQWEYACRAGTTTPFWFGENITSDQVNYNGNAPYTGGAEGQFRSETLEVKALPANGWGLYEMHGNVWEWCAGWAGEYPKDAAVDPQGPAEGRERVRRGENRTMAGTAGRRSATAATLADASASGLPEGCWIQRGPGWIRQPRLRALRPTFAGHPANVRDSLGGRFAGPPLLEGTSAPRLSNSSSMKTAFASAVESTSSPLPSLFPEVWASGWGQERHGLWQSFTVKNVVQRLRWIPPGEFLMGSPTKEPERAASGEYGEIQHPVVLTRGFWLADMACTHALWQAVLDENPSAFKGADRPVDNVSWNDVTERFLPALERLVPGLAPALPTEAQWEYACRAGTKTPFWFGETITTDQVNYDGDYPYAEGAKGKFRQETVPVKALPANGWGLYQMHGNVGSGVRTGQASIRRTRWWTHEVRPWAASACCVAGAGATTAGLPVGLPRRLRAWLPQRHHRLPACPRASR